SRARKRALFERALRELRLPLPDRLSAVRMLRQHYAQQVVNGVLHPDAGAYDLVRLNRAYVRTAQSRPCSLLGGATTRAISRYAQKAFAIRMCSGVRHSSS